MGWEGSDRHARLPLGWERRRQQALRDCGHMCQSPGCVDSASEVDHIIPGDDHSRRNLQGLCDYHHKLKSSSEGHAAKRRMRELKRRPVGRHPGAR